MTAEELDELRSEQHRLLATIRREVPSKLGDEPVKLRGNVGVSSELEEQVRAVAADMLLSLEARLSSAELNHSKRTVRSLSNGNVDVDHVGWISAATTSIVSRLDPVNHVALLDEAKDEEQRKVWEKTLRDGAVLLELAEFIASKVAANTTGPEGP